MRLEEIPSAPSQDEPAIDYSQAGHRVGRNDHAPAPHHAHVPARIQKHRASRRAGLQATLRAVPHLRDLAENPGRSRRDT
jgi:hypothetical protein